MDKDNTQEKVYDQKHVDGMTKDLQKERSDRQEAQFNLDSSRRKLEALEKTVEELKNSKPTELVSDKIQFSGEENEPATVKEVKLGFKNLEKEATAKFKAAQKAAGESAKQEALKAKFDESCQQAISKYINRKDIGLDFQTVYQAALKQIGRNKYEELAIYHSANPGEAIYKRGCEDPEIKAKLDLEENQELLKNMGSRKVDKDSLTGGTKIKSTEFFTPEEVTAMTPLEASKVMPKIEKSQKHWAEQKKK